MYGFREERVLVGKAEILRYSNISLSGVYSATSAIRNTITNQKVSNTAAKNKTFRTQALTLSLFTLIVENSKSLNLSDFLLPSKLEVKYRINWRKLLLKTMRSDN